MKSFLLSLMLFCSVPSFGANVVTDPASTAANTISPSASGVVGLTVDNSGSTSSGETAVSIKNVGSSNPALKVESSDWDAISAQTIYGAGGYFYSQEFYAIMGTSLNESSAWFSSSASQNTKPTVLIQGIGGSANLLEVQDAGFNPLMSIDSSGAVKASSGLQLPSSGSCDASHRRFMKVVEGGSGVADQFQVCLKNAAGSYLWVTK